MSDDAPQPAEQQPTPLPAELQEALADLPLTGALAGGVPALTVAASDLVPLLARLRSLPAPYDMLTDLCGVDRGEEIEVVYRLYRAFSSEGLVVKVRVPREGGEVPTITHLWKLAGWPEREVAEMFGVTFAGHPDPRKLLLPDDFTGFPLRKDFVIDRSNPYLAPDPLREDPLTVLYGEEPSDSDPVV